MVMKIMNEYKIGLFILICLCVIGSFGLNTQGVGASYSFQEDDPVTTTACLISSPNTEFFPVVSLDFRVLNDKLTAVEGIDRAAVQIIENNYPVPALIDFSSNEYGVGLNVYFVVDQGQLTNQKVVKLALERYANKYMREGLDNVAIISSEKNKEGSNITLVETSSVSEFSSVVNQMPTWIGYRRSPFPAIIEALNKIKANDYGCARSNVIIVLAGQDSSIDPEKGLGSEEKALAHDLLATHTPIHFVHVDSGKFINGEQAYKDFTDLAKGTYRQVIFTQTEEFSYLDQGVFAPLMKERYTYHTEFRSNDGSTGEHEVRVTINGQEAATDTNASTFPLRVDDPIVTISAPANDAVITRNGDRATEAGISYDKDVETVEFAVSFPDGYPRYITSATITYSSENGEHTEQVPTIDGGVIRHDWDLRDITAQGDNPIVIQVTVVDELNRTGTSNPASVLVHVNVPTLVPGQTIIETHVVEETPGYIKYVLIALGVIVTALVILLISMRRQIARLGVGGALKNVVAVVRETLVPKKRGKPIAELKIIDGPPNMVGNSLPIYIESIKLGRDPIKSNLTFYSPDANTSVSGLHCRLERAGGQWRIVALSESQSETFVDNQSISFHEPYPVMDGQIIRLGYLGQMPVEFQLVVVDSTYGEGSSAPAGTPTDVKDVRSRVDEPFYSSDEETLKSFNTQAEEISASENETDDINPDSFFDQYR
jgi:hypothetical protein